MSNFWGAYHILVSTRKYFCEYVVLVWETSMSSQSLLYLIILMRLPFCCSLAILKNTLPLHQIKVPPLETGAELMAALWEVFLFCKCKVSDYSLAFCFYMEF